MKTTILDCYTDEPSGLGVPPYLGVYPRYIYGKLMYEGRQVQYLTIDDLRLSEKYKGKIKPKQKTDITIHNLTGRNASEIIKNSDELIVILGVHVPGKYLSAIPGTLNEVTSLIKNFNTHKTLTGPAASEFGTQIEGGKFAEKNDLKAFNKVIPDYLTTYDEIREASVLGSNIIKQIPYEVIVEIETGRGCKKTVPCSYCTEPLKNKFEQRSIEDIKKEIEGLHKQGIRHFRIGKQPDFFSWDKDEMEEILKSTRAMGVKTLHIDNCDPVNVTTEKVETIVKYCTPGNVAALGVESFDKEVVKKNQLNSSPEITMKAIRTINKHGAVRGENGMQSFLPGVNILFGLIGETKETNEENMKYFKQIIDEKLLLRRINIRQVAIYKGTEIDKVCGNKFLRKNKKHYWKWRNEIRQKVDLPMLKSLVPLGTVLTEVRMEVHDGNNTFGRQFGTYPLIVGVRKKLELNRTYNIKVTGHMLRSITGEIIS